MAASLSIGMLCSGVALAQSTMSAPGNGSDNSTNPTMQNKMNPATQPGMAATSSDSGNAGTGASSAAMGTGGTEKGVFSPEAPAVGASQGETGANPQNAGGVPKSD
jgi:hypothetical protein